MKGHIADYDSNRQIGIISSDDRSFYFGHDVWNAENPPYIGCSVIFDTEGSIDQKHPKVTYVNLDGEYLGPIGEPVKSRKLAAALSVLLGGAGIGRFYLGHYKIGVLQIIATVLTLGFGVVWGFIEGILLLMNRIIKDARGRPLK